MEIILFYDWLEPHSIWFQVPIIFFPLQTISCPASNSEFFVQSTISGATRRHQIRTMCATPGWTTIGWSSVVKLGMPCSSTAGVSSRWCFHVRPVSPDRCSVWHPLAAASSQVRWSYRLRSWLTLRWLIDLCLYIYININIYIYVCIYIYIYQYLCLHLYLSLSLFLCVHVCMYIFKYI